MGGRAIEYRYLRLTLLRGRPSYRMTNPAPQPTTGRRFLESSNFDLHCGVRGDLSVDRLTCRMPPMGVFRRCKRACALQVAGKALSSQGPDFTRSHNQIWSTTPLRLKKNFDADNSRCC